MHVMDQCSIRESYLSSCRIQATADCCKRTGILQHRSCCEYVKVPVAKAAVVGTSFSRPCLQFWRNRLYVNPDLGYAIIDRLMCDGSKENFANNQELQGLFLKCIDGSLNSLLAPCDRSQHQ